MPKIDRPMPSTNLFFLATLLLSLNFIRPFGLAISDWLYFGALGLAFIETFTIEHRNAQCWWQNRFFWLVALILFGALGSTMNSQNVGVAIVEIFQQIFVLTLFISMAWILVRRGKINSVIYAFVLSGVFTAGIVLVDKLTGSNWGPTLSGAPDVQLWGRFAGTLGHPNKLGYFLVLTTLLSIGQLLSLRSSNSSVFSRLVWCGLIGVQGVGIYLSGSMTAYLGLLTGIAFLALSSWNIFVKMAKTFGILVVGSVFAMWLVLATQLILIDGLPTLSNNDINLALARIQSYTAESRLTTYTQAWDQIINNPWFGVGYDQISTSGISSQSRFLDFAVHNSLLQIWYTGGLFAFLGWVAVSIWVGLMALGIIRLGKRNNLSPLLISLAAAVMAILLMDQFQDSIYEREKWLVIGLLAGISWERAYIKLLKPGYENSRLIKSLHVYPEKPLRFPATTPISMNKDEFNRTSTNMPNRVSNSAPSEYR
jgi:O-antigen ligase